jgi:hypothetical protein
LLDNLIAVYRSAGDVFFFVVGNIEDNELILLTVLNGIYDTMSKLVTYRSFIAFDDWFVGTIVEPIHAIWIIVLFWKTLTILHLQLMK